MSICICPRREGADPKCRAPRVTEAGGLYCAFERALEAAIVRATCLADPQVEGGAVSADTVTLLCDLRAQGWTIRPPRKVTP